MPEEHLAKKARVLQRPHLCLVLGWHLDSTAPLGDGHLLIRLALCHLRVHVLIIVPLHHNNTKNNDDDNKNACQLMMS